MFNIGIGDRVQHKKSGNLGEVLGHGHRIVDGAYLPTLKVRVDLGTKIKTIVEDLSSEWRFQSTELIPSQPKKRILSDVA